MPSRKWTEEQLIKGVQIYKSYTELFEFLGISLKSESSKCKVRAEVKRLGLDVSHFEKKTNKGHRKHVAKDLFRKGINFNTSIRRYFVARTENKCSICGINEWLGKPLTLQVDHIDGDRSNNLLENLRLLCGNCHSQTETWGVQKAHRRMAS